MSGRTGRNGAVLLVCAAVLGGMGGLVAYAPTLYQMFCAATGFGGTVQRLSTKSLSAQRSDTTLRVHFDANVAPGLDWEFRPEQREVTTHFGEPTKIYYYAKNNSDHTVVARATYNVVPIKSATYFFKVQCFCFTDEKLKPGESAHMPVVLYVDEQLLKDPETSEVRDITLSYTFYAQGDPTAEELAQARDLSAGSAAEETQMKTDSTATFANEAPRR